MTKPPYRRICAALVLGGSLLLDAAQEGPEHAARMKAGRALFTRSIRPALTTHCLKCHGGEKTRSELDMGSRDKLLKGGESGPVIDLADAGKSRLLTLVRHADAKIQMPPKKAKLPDSLIADLERWISLGAPYDKPLAEGRETASGMTVTDSDRAFWSFKPLKVDAPPRIEDPWARTAIDAFVLEPLNRQGLAPNPPADRRTLARRASLDLTGLPPGPEELKAYLEDSRPDAWERLLERLLASPHYGERQARHWMDVARFAESDGFEHDYDRKTAYHYRDALIEAFNADTPWDRLVGWQLAGDELEPGNPLAWKATGFLSAGVFPTQITEAEFEQARYDELDDMVGTTSVAFLGLSVGCARCHDHKYDPIPTRDYYNMTATFATAIRSEKELGMDSEAFREKWASWEEKRLQLEQVKTQYETATLASGFQAWLKKPGDLDTLTAGTWQVLDPSRVVSREGATLTRQADGSWLASGKNPANEEYTIEATAAAGAAALRIEALTHKSFPRNGPGRAGNGNFALGNLRIEARPLNAAKAKPHPITFTDARATHQQNTGTLSVKSSYDKDPDKSGWAVDRGGIGKDQAAVFVFDQPLETTMQLSITMRFHVNTSHTFGRMRLAVARDADADIKADLGASGLLVEAVEALKSGTLNDVQRKTLRDVYVGQDAGWAAHNKKLQQHNAARPQPKKEKVLVCSEGVKPVKNHADGRGYPHFYPEVHHLTRGDPKQKGAVAEAGFLQVLMPGDGKPQTRKPKGETDSKLSYRRAALAHWLTDPEKGCGHLLARVMVNRLWQQHFGRGIVATPNDFGFQGERPTHPALLDWLADDLIRHQWRLKHTHKLIMRSAVYRQSTVYDPRDAAKDIDNRFLWRFAPRRLEAEAVRDSLLAVSGTLDRRMYGPGSLNESMARRSIYFTIKRSRLPNAMLVFDWPEHLVSMGKRPNTTVAPQALYLMNSPQVRHYAKGLAGRAKQSVDAAYQLALGRPATDAEKEAATAFMGSQAARYPGGSTAAAFTDFCQALMASNEFLYLP
jgi:mono/diheme cytochrome c family protein